MHEEDRKKSREREGSNLNQVDGLENPFADPQTPLNYPTIFTPAHLLLSNFRENPPSTNGLSSSKTTKDRRRAFIDRMRVLSQQSQGYKTPESIREETQQQESIHKLEKRAKILKYTKWCLITDLIGCTVFVLCLVIYLCVFKSEDHGNQVSN
ncbi:hypothetical protein BN7_1849 [Wickerhamomyces ciferrii]|uniref:Uncharacterized protein n=1 Tax=Wickerhamomyces ciferrii (strain ATCC 14091 / BCRC 22168 / CBS 111 / JCM 3599 / NBRC 0793 / NRRL Y-1031 F-60-10) TaxID=1206466 RepID=K0KBC5_WICCF|nr:uncharacterized protein BN7_1849 [Wickerhamomyces ciferrii]CCH42305.1 hypothetical protein BN7_1849 [Wickerhamomyces ciferrii]